MTPVFRQSVPPTRETTVLMCPPTYFGVSYPDNQYTLERGQAYVRAHGLLSLRAQAQKQWKALRRLLRDLGAEVVEISPQDGLEDQVYAADASQSYVLDDGRSVTVLSRFALPTRRGEVVRHEETIRALFPAREIVTSAAFLEGTGDCIYDPFRDCIWAGYSASTPGEDFTAGRSSREGHGFLSDVTGIDVQSLQVDHGRYHLDTAVAFLSTGHVVVDPSGLHPDSFRHLKEQAFARFRLPENEFLIEITPEEAAAFATNIVQFRDTLIMPRCGERLEDRLESLGYTVHQLDFDALMVDGGGPKCCINKLDQRRVVGGFFKG